MRIFHCQTLSPSSKHSRNTDYTELGVSTHSTPLRNTNIGHVTYGTPKMCSLNTRCGETLVRGRNTRNGSTKHYSTPDEAVWNTRFLQCR